MSDKAGIVSFIQAMRHYFGYLPGNAEASHAFLQEYKALTDEDKAELRTMLRGVGYINIA